jgi:zinc D-Ala-D-Ala carboxypeptidase
MMLSENLSITEFSKSNTAKRKGINNTPKGVHLEAAKELAQNIFQPIREYFATPIFLSSGYRSVALNTAVGGSCYFTTLKRRSY